MLYLFFSHYLLIEFVDEVSLSLLNVRMVSKPVKVSEKCKNPGLRQIDSSLRNSRDSCEIVRWCPVLSSSRSGKKSDWLSGRSLPILKMDSSKKCIAQKGNKWAIEKTDWRRRHHLPLLVARTFSSTSYSWTTKQTIQKLILSMCVLLSTCLAKTFQLIWKLCWRSFWLIFLRQNNSVSVTNENSVSNKLKKIVVEVISKIKMALNLFWHIP